MAGTSAERSLNAVTSRSGSNAFVRSVASMRPSWLRRIRSWSSEATSSSAARISSRSACSAASSRGCAGSKRSSKYCTSLQVTSGFAARTSFWYACVKREPIRWRYIRYARRIATWRQVRPATSTSRFSVSDSVSPRRDLLHHAQPEVLERRHRVAELDLAARLVERDAGQAAVVLQPDHEGQPLALQPLERGDVGDGGVRRGRGAVVAGEARAPARGELPPPDGAEAVDEAVAQPVVPRAGEVDELLLEVVQRHLGDPVGRVDRDVDPDAVALPQHGLRVHRIRAEALAQEPGERVEQVGVVARGGQRRDERDAAAVVGAAPEQPHLVALERQQLDDRAPQIVRAGGEQLVLRDRVEQRDGGLVVVRPLDEVLVAEDLAQLAIEQRRLGGGLGVGLGGEQAEQPRLAGHAAVVADLADADVVHPHPPVDRREPVRLRNDQPVALQRALADAGGQG